MRLKHSRNTKGFTLIEILVVIAIIAGLSAIAYPVIIRQVDRGRETQARSMLKDIVTATDKYLEDHNGLLPLEADGDDAADTAADVYIDTKNDPYFIAALGGFVESHNNAKGKPYFTAKKIAAGERYGAVMDATDPKKISELVDPWGRPYILMLNVNGDDKIDVGTITSDPFKILTADLKDEEVSGQIAGYSLGSVLESSETEVGKVYPNAFSLWKMSAE